MSAHAKWAGAALLLALAAGVLPAQQPGAAAAGDGKLRPSRLYGIVSSGLLPTLNHNDAVASIKAWFEIVGKERGFILDSKVETSNNLAEIRRRLTEGSVDLLILDITDYLRLERTGLVRPTLLGSRTAAGRPQYSYVLLVGPASGAQNLAGLRGKKLSYFSRHASNTSLAWLELTLGKERLGRAASFFGDAKSVSSPQECVLPLFFGRVDACIVDEVNLELLKEMNPQLGKLRTLAKSVQLVDSVIALPVTPLPYQQELIEAILGLHLGPRGKQLLMVFKTARLLAVRPGDLDSARAFWAEHGKLAGGGGKE
jgi:ABC-type phosphate/phosphonate transport system substrate-binding protein